MRVTTGIIQVVILTSEAGSRDGNSTTEQYKLATTIDCGTSITITMTINKLQTRTHY
jgi:hypothetical protein